MQQLVMNLVINAAEAIGEQSGRVLVRTGKRQVDGGAHVLLEVQDTGCGMDEETRSRIFDPFFSTKFTGRGLGLSAVQGIVRGHKGSIEVGSVPGAGSIFTVLLPPVEGAVAAPVDALPPDREALAGSGLILVADDEPLVRHTAKVSLEWYGYTVLGAENGFQAVDLFRRDRKRIRAVLLDLTMPVMSGEEAYAEIRRICPDVPVLLSSGYDEMEATRRFAGKGIAGFLKKPYTARKLAEKIKAAQALRAAESRP